MTYVVIDNCIACKYTDCVEVCPVDCFYEGENMLVIHPDECIDCGVCEPECPADAIRPDTEPDMEKWVEFNRKYSEAWPVIVSKKDPMPGYEEKDGETVISWEKINKAQALWTRNKSEITDEEYKEFYKHIAHDFNDPLTWSHNRVEGTREYTSLLYIPAAAPFLAVYPDKNIAGTPKTNQSCSDST